MVEQIEEDVNRIAYEFANAVLTKSEVEQRLLELIDLHGANDVLSRSPLALRTIAKQWYDDAPKSKEEWRKQTVFDLRPGVSGMRELYSALLTDEEIAARLRVLESLRDYFQRNSR